MFDDPTRDRDCYVTCTSCFRCADKGRFAKCATCSGRPDPERRRYPDPDDYCRCKEGVLQYKTKEGRLLVAKIPGNPFGSKIESEKETVEERDYNAMVKRMREKTGDPNWDPVRFENGLSAYNWYDRYKKGQVS